MGCVKIWHMLTEGKGGVHKNLTFADGGGGGPKWPKKCWRHKWTAPNHMPNYHIVSCFYNSNMKHFTSQICYLQPHGIKCSSDRCSFIVSSNLFSRMVYEGGTLYQTIHNSWYIIFQFYDQLILFFVLLGVLYTKSEITNN